VAVVPPPIAELTPPDVPDTPVELHHQRVLDVGHIDEPVAARPRVLPLPREEAMSSLNAKTVGM